jgi:hypothetical protein
MGSIEKVISVQCSAVSKNDLSGASRFCFHVYPAVHPSVVRGVGPHITILDILVSNNHYTQNMSKRFLRILLDECTGKIHLMSRVISRDIRYE